jgi:hypothetical protein
MYGSKQGLINDELGVYRGQLEGEGIKGTRLINSLQAPFVYHGVCVIF